MKHIYILAFLLSLGFTANAARAPMVCAIQTSSGRFLSAVNGGGMTNDALHSDATQIQSWEIFTFVDSGQPGVTRWGIKTLSGFYLTAVSGGNRTTDVIHTDGRNLNDWEKFTLVYLGGNSYAIRTSNGHFLTAVSGGNRTNDVIHSDAIRIGAWERFRLRCIQ